MRERYRSRFYWRYNPLKTSRVEESMKKINSKIISIVILLMTLLISGGLAVQESIGRPTQGIDLEDGMD